MTSTKWIYPYYWDEEKNILLKETRGMNFDDVIERLLDGKIIDFVDHHNPDKYPNQRKIIIDYEWYMYYIPCVMQEDGSFFLKTIIPSRKLVKDYL